MLFSSSLKSSCLIFKSGCLLSCAGSVAEGTQLGDGVKYQHSATPNVSYMKMDCGPAPSLLGFLFLRTLGFTQHPLLASIDHIFPLACLLIFAARVVPST